MLRTAVAVRNLAFEDLGCFEDGLQQAGYKVHYYDVGLDDLWTLDPIKTELLVVLGGPIGANDEDDYPYLTDLLDILKRRIAAKRPTLGICLGAQLIARALGARVYPAKAKEIGFAPIQLTEAGRRSPLAGLDAGPVLHWHGDTFDLPAGAIRLAATEICENQAFSYGGHVLAFQFHPEAGGKGFERWLIGHTLELSQAGKSIRNLRATFDSLAPDLQRRAHACLDAWLRTLPRD